MAQLKVHYSGHSGKYATLKLPLNTTHVPDVEMGIYVFINRRTVLLSLSSGGPVRWKH